MKKKVMLREDAWALPRLSQHESVGAMREHLVVGIVWCVFVRFAWKIRYWTTGNGKLLRFSYSVQHFIARRQNHHTNNAVCTTH